MCIYVYAYTHIHTQTIHLTLTELHEGSTFLTKRRLQLVLKNGYNWILSSRDGTWGSTRASGVIYTSPSP